MVWLVTIWRQKYHMSKSHLIPALPPVLDKENEVQEQHGQPLPWDLQSQSGCVRIGGTVEPQRLSDPLSISAPRRKTMQLISLYLFNSRPTRWVQTGVKHVARHGGRWMHKLLQARSLESCGKNVLGVLKNSISSRTMIKILNSHVNLNISKAKNSGCSTVGRGVGNDFMVCVAHSSPLYH